jgi:hypothetical protein
MFSVRTRVAIVLCALSRCECRNLVPGFHGAVFAVVLLRLYFCSCLSHFCFHWELQLSCLLLLSSLFLPFSGFAASWGPIILAAAASMRTLLGGPGGMVYNHTRYGDAAYTGGFPARQRSE